jgi:predicted unusual protein kinase regulating ubiquinone biosynthesis (AarF/ABC1/UbiB family)
MTTTTEGGIYLKEKLVNLGILGIKLGQYLYSQSLIINNDVKNILEPLLSHNKIHTKEETQQMLDFADSNKYNDIIESIDHVNILGSGSLAQTHICYIKNEYIKNEHIKNEYIKNEHIKNEPIKNEPIKNEPTKKYVLKVAHPEILNLENEVNVVKNIIKMASFFKKIKVNWNGFFENISEQCDLNNEANHMKKFYEIYKNYDKIEIPELIYSNKYFIIMSFCEGTQMNKLDKNSEEYISGCKLLSSCFFHTSYKYNIIHGDLHPGNILVKENGYISLVDFGICIELNKNSNKILYNLRNLMLYNTSEHFLYFLKNIIHNYYYYVSKINMYEQSEELNEVTEMIESINILDMTVFVNKLVNFCRENNILLLENNLYFITQFLLLECFFTVKGIHFTFKTLHYMKNDSFFMNEMSTYILDFYELEYSNLDNDEYNIKDTLEEYT